MRPAYYSFYLLLIIFVSPIESIGVFGQSAIFTPEKDNEVLLKSLSDKYEKQFQQSLNSLPSENKKDLAELYKWRWNNVKDKFDTKEIYTNGKAQNYLDALVGEIVKANPLLKEKKFNCYFSKTGIPNASYIGEGIILFNMGLFNRLENESQAAFVLCHEISHYYLEHLDNSIKNYVVTLNSKEYQKELKNIKNSEYNKREQLDKLLKNVSFNFTRHSRDHESEADSMALVFMSNTRFSVHESITTLALLDAIDTDSLKTAECLERNFNAKDYPFQKKWLSREEGLLGGHAKIEKDKKLADSLKTHPDCKQRIRTIEPVVHRFSKSSSVLNPIDNSTFEKLRDTFRYEIVEFALKSDDYTRSLHYTLELLQKHPSDPYLIAHVGKIFNGLYKAQKKHTLGKITSLPSPSYQSNYNLLLQFIQNLYADDYASISYHFLKQHSPQLDSYLPFKNAYTESIQIAKQ